MKVPEVARRLDVSISLVYGLLTSGRLRGTRHGLKRGTWRVSEEQLAAYMAGAEANADRPPEPVRQKLKHIRI